MTLLILTLLAADRELAVFPFTAKLNTTLSTRQYGFSARALYPFHERCALMLSGKLAYGPLDREETAWVDSTLHFEPAGAASPLVVGAALLGFEGKPVIGTLEAYGSKAIEFALVLGVSMGAGATRFLLNGRSFDTGWHLMAQVGGGLRIKLRDWLILRFELHDLLVERATKTVSGCNGADLKAMDQQLRTVGSVTGAMVSGNCNVSRFDGYDDGGRNRSDDLPLAYAMVRNTASGFQHVVELYVGAGLAF